MKYYDIHTHQPPVHSEDIGIVNTVVDGGEEAKSISPYRSYGIHPWYIYNVGEQMKCLRQYVLLPETVAIGEAGLDKLAQTDMELQEEVFRLQALLAEEVRKPLIIHCVKAWPELLRIKKEVSPRMPWIIHGFRGKEELAKQLTDQGFYLSFGEKFHAEALTIAWPGKILAETDDSPSGIREVYKQMAESLSLPLEELACRLMENSRYLFGLFK